MSVESAEGKRTQAARARSVGLVSSLGWVVLLLLPSTGWLMRQQMEALVQPPHALSALLYDLGAVSPQAKSAPRPDAARVANLVQQRPNNYPLQVAAAVERTSSKEVAERLEVLLPLFPSRPALYAHILRFKTSGEIRLHRPEGDILTGDAPGSRSSAFSSPPPARLQLEAFDQEAAAGERLDADNAYFPLLRSIGLFASHRDVEALAAIERASKKPRWDDYIADEVHSRWHLRETLYGRQSAVLQVVAAASVLYPHYAQIRGVARLATYLAMRKEQAGRAEEGLAIRRTLMRCGELLRAKSQTLIGSLVGMAISAIAQSRPGGAPVVKRPASMSTDQWAKKRVEDFAAYAERKGHAEDARYARAAFEAATRTRDISQNGVELSPAMGIPTFELIGLWIAGMIVLSNGLWMLLMGGAAALLSRLRAGTGVFAVLIVCGLVVLGVVAWSLTVWSGALATVWEVLKDLTSSGQEQLFGGITHPMMIGLTIATTVVVPVLLGLILLIVASVRNRPFAASLSRGMFVGSLMVVVFYAALLVYTLRYEHRISSDLEQSLHGEGRLLAQSAGKSYPEITPE